MLFLIIGLGSVGQRHVRNLRSLLGQEAEFIALRTRGLQRVISDDGASSNSIEQVYGIRTYVDLDTALSQRPVAAFVCNPTSLHVPMALAAARAGCHLFIEKPVSHTMDGLAQLQRVVRDKGLQAMVGFQYRFHPGLAAVRELIQQQVVGRITHVHAHWGEYLPGWHPWENHRESYSGRSALGGGVILTLCHPLDYLRWIFGEVRAVFAAVGHEGALEIDVEDTADIIMQFESRTIGSVHLDYLQRPASHTLQIVGHSGSILWDNENGCVQYYCSSHGEWQLISPPSGFQRNALFLEEAQHFLDCVAGEAEPLTSLEEGVRTLEIALAAKRSAAEGRLIELPK